MSLMNKSEVQEKKFDNSIGWTCPNCGRVWSPFVKTCPCSKSEGQAKDTKNWIKD